MSDKIKIYLSKKKITLLFLASVLFVVFGFWGIIRPEDFVSTIFRNPIIIRVSGIVSVCFFGLGVVLITPKFFDSKPGLIIDESGIIDNTNATSVGLIEWGDIKGIEKIEILSTKILIILINNPDKYIDRAKNFISKKAMRVNHKKYGSPISIISNSLKIGFEDLEELVLKEWKKSQTHN